MFIGESQQEPVGALEFLATDAAWVLQVLQVFRRLDVADAPTEECNGLRREPCGPLVVGVQSLQFLAGEDELQSEWPHHKLSLPYCALAFTLWVYATMEVEL